MMILVTYDIDMTRKDGASRLRKVAKICTNYGTRVQNSVFECVVDSSQMVVLKKQLLDVYDEERDSIRIYNLGEKYNTKVQHYGAKPSVNIEDTLIF